MNYLAAFILRLTLEAVYRARISGAPWPNTSQRAHRLLSDLRAEIDAIEATS